jgi:transposase-like protein
MKGPSFCVNKDCEKHSKENKRKHWYAKYGFYNTKVRGKIQRFRCKICGKTFSVQTFSLDYCVKKKLSYRKIMKYSSESMSLSSISRMLNTSVESISNRITRLSRQITYYHNYLKSEINLKEALTSDGFESFVKSQYFPNNIHLLGGKESQYLYFFNYVLLKRKGRKTKYQEERLRKLYKKVNFEKRALSNSFSEVIDEFFELAGTSDINISLYTDMKPEYKSVFRNHKLYSEYKDRISHKIIHSKQHRIVSDDTFTNDYLDRELRKDQANHRRETKCFSRNVCSCLDRINVYFFYHNYIKDYRVKNSIYRGISHAEVAGVPKGKIRKVLKEMFYKRIFLSLENIKSFGKRLWEKKIITPLKKRNEYIPQYAFM